MTEQISVLKEAILQAEKNSPLFAIPKDEAFTPSEGFERELAKRVRMKRPPLFVYRKNGALLRKLLIVASAAILLAVLGVAAWSAGKYVGALKEDKRPTHSIFRFDATVSEPKSRLEERYGLPDLPEDWQTDTTFCTSVAQYTRYKLPDGGFVEYKQMAGEVTLGLDTENAEARKTAVRGNEGLLIENERSDGRVTILLWDENGYIFSFTAFSSDLCEEDLLQLAQSLAVLQNL